MDVILPVGISFYTFQTLSYVIDVYNNKFKCEYNIIYYALYVSFFPQLVAGPIERPDRLLPQLKSKDGIKKENIEIGLVYMLIGFVKKVTIADMIGVYVDKVYNNLNECNGILVLIATFLFSIQILCDFSGYSDIAIGTAKLFNIDLMKNFDKPYKSLSIKEFWNRWHISLSCWLKDYIYYPLGGSKVNKFRHIINILIVFLVSGIWHGANYTFIIWGLMHGILRIIETIFPCLTSIPKSKILKILKNIFIFIIVSLTWVAFRSNNINDMLEAYKLLFTNYSFNKEYINQIINILNMNTINLVLIFISLILFIFIDYLNTSNFKKINEVIRCGIYIILSWIVLFSFIYSSRSGVSPTFIYFQF